jgi:hypothetical protein
MPLVKRFSLQDQKIHYFIPYFNPYYYINTNVIIYNY